MEPSKDYYQTLGVAREATDEQIKSAYRALARKLHPDVNRAPDAAAKFAALQEAYDVLSDQEKRRNYDRYGTADPSVAGYGPEAPRRPRSGTYTWTNVGGRPPSDQGDFDAIDAASIFEEVFGRTHDTDPFSTFGRGSKAKARPSRGRDLEQDVVLEFRDAVQGGKKSVRVTRGGRTQTVEVSIPPGVAAGTKLRMRGMGAPSTGHAPPGDLILTVHIAPHELFRREADDLLLDLPLTIVEATLGAVVNVPTLSGKVEITIPPGTSSGQRLRLRGLGIRPEGRPAGDLYAVIRIVAPRDLPAEDLETLRALGAKLPSPREGRAWS